MMTIRRRPAIDVAVVELSEWQTASPDTCPALSGMRLADDAETRRMVERLAGTQLIGLRELRAGVEVSTYSFVGSLTLGPLTLKIRPKLEPAAFATLIAYALGLPDIHQLPEHSARLNAAAFQDILIDRLADEASRLLARGVYRHYMRQRMPLESLRGRILFTDVVRSGHSAVLALPCEFHERDEDVLPNRVLLAGLQLAGRLAVDARVRRRTLRAAAALAEHVQPAHLDATTLRALARAHTRLLTAYEPALALIRLLMAGHGLSTEETQESFPLPGFLLNMNRLFQAAIGRFLRESLGDIQVHEEHSLRDLFAYQESFNPRRRRTPAPRPDFLFTREGTVVGIADAKYRDLWEHDLPRDMLYQLSVYALSQSHCRTTVILYPAADAGAREARISIKDPMSGSRRAEVCLRPLHVRRLTELLRDSRSVAAQRARQEYARYLVFGRSEPSAPLPA
jgi:5-methylcytosine-specific restriction enzyme subunit McrC